MIVDLTKEEEKIKISNSKEIYEILIKILDREEGLGFNQEHFWVVGLSEDYMLLFVELVALGTSNRFIVDPKEVFYVAVHKQSKYVVLAHNHPGESVEPSEADEDLTDQLMHAAELLNLKVIDHLIVTSKTFCSFNYRGVLDKLEKSKKYAVYFIEEEKLLTKGEKVGMKKGLKKGKEIGKIEGIEIGEERGLKKGERKGEKKKALDIAKKMLSIGLKIDHIVKSTGLKKSEIEKLPKAKLKVKKT